MHVLVRIVGARWLAALEIRVVEDLLGVCGWEAGDDYVAVAVRLVFFVCHDSLRFPTLEIEVWDITSRFGMNFRGGREVIVEIKSSLELSHSPR